MLTAVDFAKRLQGAAGCTFGVDAPNTAAELRELARKIEAGEVYLQKVQVSSTAYLENFTSTRLFVVVHEPKNPQLRPLPPI